MIWLAHCESSVFPSKKAAVGLVKVPKQLRSQSSQESFQVRDGHFRVILEAVWTEIGLKSSSFWPGFDMIWSCKDLGFLYLDFSHVTQRSSLSFSAPKKGFGVILETTKTQWGFFLAKIKNGGWRSMNNLKYFWMISFSSEGGTQFSLELFNKIHTFQTDVHWLTLGISAASPVALPAAAPKGSGTQGRVSLMSI